jgi:hypothetical protein
LQVRGEDLERTEATMSGKIRRMLDDIIRQKSGGRNVLATVIETKLILKGIDPRKFDASSPDDPAMIAKIESVAKEMDVAIHH